MNSDSTPRLIWCWLDFLLDKLRLVLDGVAGRFFSIETLKGRVPQEVARVRQKMSGFVYLSRFGVGTATVFDERETSKRLVFSHVP